MSELFVILDFLFFLFFLYAYYLASDQERDWPPRRVFFFGLVKPINTALNVRNYNILHVSPCHVWDAHKV